MAPAEHKSVALPTALRKLTSGLSLSLASELNWASIVAAVFVSCPSSVIYRKWMLVKIRDSWLVRQRIKCDKIIHNVFLDWKNSDLLCLFQGKSTPWNNCILRQNQRTTPFLASAHLLFLVFPCTLSPLLFHIL